MLIYKHLLPPTCLSFCPLRLFRVTVLLGIALFSPLLLRFSASTAFAQAENPNLSSFSHSPTDAATPVEQWLHVSDLTYPVINHPMAQEFPAIQQGRVVWQDGRTGPADIFLADLASHEIRNLTNSDQWEANPDIDGDFVIWRDGYAGLGVHGMRISTGEVFTVTTGHSVVNSPRISQGYVVWAAMQPGDKEWKIYGFDIATQQKTLIYA